MPAFSSADPNAFVGLSLKQTGLGTPNVTAAGYRFVKYISGLNFDPQQDVTFIREGGDGLDWGSGYLKTWKGVGQLVFYARPEITGQFLSIMPGGATWNGGTVPATHIFHTGHASFPYVTMIAGHPGRPQSCGEFTMGVISPRTEADAAPVHRTRSISWRNATDRRPAFAPRLPFFRLAPGHGRSPPAI